MTRKLARMSAAVLFAFLAGCDDDPTPLAVLFTKPGPNQQVTGTEISVYGTYSPRGLKDDIWVLVWPGQAPGRGWPQSLDGVGNRPVERDIAGTGTWMARCNLGGPPQPYELRVYTANRDASTRLRDILIDWERKRDWPGLTQGELPAGLELRDSRNISRIQ